MLEELFPGIKLRANADINATKLFKLLTSEQRESTVLPPAATAGVPIADGAAGETVGMAGTRRNLPSSDLKAHKKVTSMAGTGSGAGSATGGDSPSPRRGGRGKSPQKTKQQLAQDEKENKERQIAELTKQTLAMHEVSYYLPTGVRATGAEPTSGIGNMYYTGKPEPLREQDDWRQPVRLGYKQMLAEKGARQARVKKKLSQARKELVDADMPGKK